MLRNNLSYLLSLLIDYKLQLMVLIYIMNIEQSLQSSFHFMKFYVDR